MLAWFVFINFYCWALHKAINNAHISESRIQSTLLQCNFVARCSKSCWGKPFKIVDYIIRRYNCVFMTCITIRLNVLG